MNGNMGLKHIFLFLAGAGSGIVIWEQARKYKRNQQAHLIIGLATATAERVGDNGCASRYGPDFFGVKFSGNAEAIAQAARARACQGLAADGSACCSH